MPKAEEGVPLSVLLNGFASVRGYVVLFGPFRSEDRHTKNTEKNLK
jgi:hypothetical protein